MQIPKMKQVKEIFISFILNLPNNCPALCHIVFNTISFCNDFSLRIMFDQFALSLQLTKNTDNCAKRDKNESNLKEYKICCLLLHVSY